MFTPRFQKLFDETPIMNDDTGRALKESTRVNMALSAWLKEEMAARARAPSGTSKSEPELPDVPDVPR